MSKQFVLLSQCNVQRQLQQQSSSTYQLPTRLHLTEQWRMGIREGEVSKSVWQTCMEIFAIKEFNVNIVMYIRETAS